MIPKASYLGGKSIVKLLFIDDQFHYSCFQNTFHCKHIGKSRWFGIFISWRVGYPLHFLKQFLGFKINDRQWCIKKTDKTISIFLQKFLIFLIIFNYISIFHFSKRKIILQKFVYQKNLISVIRANSFSQFRKISWGIIVYIII